MELLGLSLGHEGDESDQALDAIGVVAVLITACGNGSPAAVHDGPTAIPALGPKTDSAALCGTYFGSHLVRLEVASVDTVRLLSGRTG